MSAYIEQSTHRGEGFLGAGNPDAPHRRCSRAFRQPHQLRLAVARQDHRRTLSRNGLFAASGWTQLLPYAARKTALESDALMATYCAVNLRRCVLTCPSSTSLGMPRRALHPDLPVTVAEG